MFRVLHTDLQPAAAAQSFYGCCLHVTHEHLGCSLRTQECCAAALARAYTLSLVVELNILIGKLN